MKITSKKNIKKNRKHSRKNVRKNKRSRKNVGKYSRKNVMRGGVLSAELTDIIRQLKSNDPVLTTLIFSRKNIGDEGATAIAEALKTNTTLTELDIRLNGIDDEGATAIAEALKTNTTLTILNISYNNIGDAGAQAIAKALKVNKTLTIIDIFGNNIGNIGAQALAEALKDNTTLTTLDIYDNESDNIDVAKIIELTNLIRKNRETLLNTQILNEFGKTPLLDKTLETLKKIFPDIKDPNEFMIKEEMDKIYMILMCINKRHANNSSFMCPIDTIQNKIVSYSLTYGDLIKPEYYPWVI